MKTVDTPKATAQGSQNHMLSIPYLRLYLNRETDHFEVPYSLGLGLTLVEH
jgi:hypothetical protein